MLGLKRLISMLITLIDLVVKHFDVKYLNELQEQIKDCNEILDLGCGYNSPLGQIKKKNMHTVGVDIFEKYIKVNKKKNIHDESVCLDILEIDEKYPEKSFDCVLLLDVIEHLEKLDAIKLIGKVEKIARKKIVIFTPNGFFHQKEYHNNIYQRHRSGWKVKDFRKMGFKIYGIHGLKFIRGDLVKIKFRPFKLWNRVSQFSNLFVKYLPQFAFNLLCVKGIKVFNLDR